MRARRQLSAMSCQLADQKRPAMAFFSPTMPSALELRKPISDQESGSSQLGFTYIRPGSSPASFNPCREGSSLPTPTRAPAEAMHRYFSPNSFPCRHLRIGGLVANALGQLAGISIRQLTPVKTLLTPYG